MDGGRAKIPSAPLDEGAYLTLARAQTASQTQFYGSVDRTLFEKIAARRLSSEPGPSPPPQAME